MFRSLVRNRRRRAVALKIAAGLCLAFVAALLLFFAMGTERIREYAVDVVVLEDGSALVRETIDYDFAANSRHGVRREIPAT